MKDTIYDHYIAIDWADENMAIARMTKKSNKITVIDVPSDIAEVKIYLKKLKGSKILVIEETTTSQWLYTELRDLVDRMIVCDPYRNKLLNDGPKTDKIDATKLVHLLKAGLIKEVYHSSNKFIYLRRVVSGYEDMIKAGVRIKNQRYSFIKARGKLVFNKPKSDINFQNDQFVLDYYNRQIEMHKIEKKAYEEKFKEFAKLYPEIRHQKSLPGIGLINAVKIVARVVTPYRFADKGHYLSYVGLIKLERISGGRSYGRKNPRYCRQLKSVYKTSTMAAIGGNNPINDYYRYLIQEKGYPEHNARHKACRKLAVLSLGVFKSSMKYQPYHKEYVKRYN